MSKSSPKHQCASCDQRELSIFCEAKGSSIDALDESKVMRKYKKGEYLFHEGDELDGLYCIKDGAVKLENESSEGVMHLLHVVEPGGVMGYKAMLHDGECHSSARAVKDTEVCFIPKKVFLTMLEHDPKVAIAAIRKLSSEVHELESRLCHATDLSAAERVAEALLIFQDRSKDHAWKRKEIADWAGTTEETVIRTLGQLKSEGIIDTDGRKIVVLDRKLLLERARILL